MATNEGQQSSAIFAHCRYCLQFFTMIKNWMVGWCREHQNVGLYECGRYCDGNNEEMGSHDWDCGGFVMIRALIHNIIVLARSIYIHFRCK